MKIVITGASKGLGKAITSAFAADGQAHHFFLCARNQEALETTCLSLKALFPESYFYSRVCDVSDIMAIQDFVKWIYSLTNRVDVLINNAGVYTPGNACGEADGVLEKLLAINLYGAYHLTRLILPGMIQAKSGHIFNICSIASLVAYPNGGAYSISKFALYGFSKNLREELKPFGIKVTHVLPGAAYTDSWNGSDIDPHRIMEAADVARMVYAAAQLSPQACVEEIVLRPQLGDL